MPNFKKLLPTLGLCVWYNCLALAQTTDISGVINFYTEAKSINCNSIKVANSAGFNKGDKVLIIQMQGAVVDLSNSSRFGEITDFNNAGNYEFGVIEVVVGTELILQNFIQKKYTISGKVQVVRVPQYVDAKVTGLLKAKAWDGTTGGVLVFEVAGTLTLNADMDVSGAGFKGGQASKDYYNGCSSGDYYYPIASGEGGTKGEGIATYNTSIYGAGRGAIANGGGGGNHVNAGGGGGSNAATGGIGGKQWLGCPSILIGGVGGHNLNYSNTIYRVFMGGGGGGGQQNNSNGNNGTNGGGIIIISANKLEGSNFNILANGNDNTFLCANDGAGGGGAGGSVLLNINSILNINIYVKGGNGGSVNSNSGCHGTGGAGSGGLLWTNVNLTGTNVNLKGGAAGMITDAAAPCYATSYGAEAGQIGQMLNNLSFPALGSSKKDVYDSKQICKGDFYILNGKKYTQPGNYTDTIRYKSGCDSIIVHLELDVGNAQHFASAKICEGESYKLPGGNFVSIQGRYNDTIKNAFGCDSIITTTLSVGKKYLVTQNYIVCEGAIHKLPGGRIINTPGTYTDTLKSMPGCDSIIGSVINYVPNPKADFKVKHVTCYGLNDGEILVTAASGITPYTFGLKEIGTKLTGDFNNLFAGNYHYKVSDANNCVDSGLVNISQPDRILIMANPTVAIIDEGQVVQYNTTCNYTYTGLTWSPDSFLSCSACFNPFSKPTQNVIYTITAQSLINGVTCFDDTTVRIYVEHLPHFPNAFTPNNDGLNEVFKLVGVNLENLSDFDFKVFNRYGEIIFKTNNPLDGWNGKYQDAELQNGVYGYVIYYKSLKASFMKSGNVTLLR
jgi:gliding motility-associated-like protein